MMSARSMASATVSFGLVSIPVKLYPSADSSACIGLNRLHKTCGGRMKQQYYCPIDDEVVGYDDMVKGYEFTKGQYVLFTEEELKELTTKATQTIEITEFLPASTIDPIYFEKAYYLGPNKGGERPYRLLSDAMQQTERWAIARYSARGKQYLVLLRPFEQGLLMQQLRYADELRSFSEVPLGETVVKPSELKLAKQLVEQIATDQFQPAQYKDGVRERLLEMIGHKIEGKEIKAAPAEEPRAQIIDLMQALKASLSQAGGRSTGRKPAKKRPASRQTKLAAVRGKPATGGSSKRQPDKALAEATA